MRTLQKETQARVCKEFCKRLHKVWANEVLSRRKVAMANSWVLAVLPYYWGPMEWGRSRVKELDRKTRKILRQHT